MRSSRRKLLVLIAVVAIVVVSVFVARMAFLGQFDPQKVNAEALEQMQLDPPDDYIQRLESVVENNSDPYTRELAIFVLTDIAIRKYETAEIIAFLKDIAKNEEQDNVRTAAHANIDLIREYYPLDRQGALELSVLGEIKKSAEITLVAKVSSRVDVEEAVVGIDVLHQNLELLNLSVPVYRLDLRAGQPEHVGFDLLLKDVGEYEIPVTLILNFDGIDYEETKQQIALRVDESGGEVVVSGD